MIAVLVTIYTAIVLVLFKFRLLRPRPYPIALVALAGVFVVGVVVAWSLSAPMSSKLVTTQYVIALVPYVKGQVKTVHARANQPVKRGDLLLEIDPAPYQYTLNQREGQLRAAKANVEQAQAGAKTAQAALNKARAADMLAKTQEQIALNIKAEPAEKHLIAALCSAPLSGLKNHRSRWSRSNGPARQVCRAEYSSSTPPTALMRSSGTSSVLSSLSILPE
jgi:xanthosine utilization system XapX-like protein